MSSPPQPGSPALPDNHLIQALPAQPQPSSNPRRLPPPCWSHDETVALIDAYRDKWYTLRRGNLKANHWQEVADAVSRRCPAASPPKTAVQCRHKMEKLRKKYRTEIQRARSMPVSRFSSSWVHFKRMDAMEKGPQAQAAYNSGSEGDENEDENEEFEENNSNLGFYSENQNQRNVIPNPLPNARSVPPHLYRDGNLSSGGVSAASGFRIRIPNGVSIAQPGPSFYASKVDPKYGVEPNLNPKAAAFVGSSGLGSGNKREREPMEEMVGAIKVLGDGFVRMEQMKMEMAREIETIRMEMEMKRTEMILESQQRIVEAFAKAFSEKKKKPKRMASPES